MAETYIPKNILQPIIENSILHGICPKADPGNIRLEINRREENVEIIIADDGVGMDAARLEALNQEADVSSTQGGEHGLGLKLVWQIVKAHGGTVRFRQVGPHGLGICITFSAYNTR